MDKVVKDILETLNNQINSNELSAALKAESFEGEYALSDTGLLNIVSQTKELFTLESAVNNPSVIERINKDSYPKHMKTIMNKFEDKLKPVMDKLGIDYTEAEFISDKIGDIEEKINQAAAKGDNKEVIEALQKELRELHSANESREEEFNNKIQENEQSYIAKSIKDKFILTANNYTWAEAYSDHDLKGALLDKKWDKINAIATLKLSDTGEIKVYQKDSPELELYEGNKIQTFQSLLEPEINAYLKKSSPEKVTKAETTPTSDRPEMSAKKAQMIAQRQKFA